MIGSGSNPAELRRIRRLSAGRGGGCLGDEPFEAGLGGALLQAAYLVQLLKCFYIGNLQNRLFEAFEEVIFIHVKAP